jgi:transferrin binding protein
MGRKLRRSAALCPARRRHQRHRRLGGSTTATQPTAFTGTSNVAVDFSSRSVTGTMTLAGSTGAAGGPAGTISLSGGTASFSGALSSAGAAGTVVGGTTSGALFGAAAATTGGVFTTGGNTSTIGAFGGAKH